MEGTLLEHHSDQNAKPVILACISAQFIPFLRSKTDKTDIYQHTKLQILYKIFDILAYLFILSFDAKPIRPLMRLKHLFFIVLWGHFSVMASAQNADIFVPKDSVRLPFEPQKITIHSQGFLLSDKKGNLFLVDSTGEIRQNYSQNQQSELTNFKNITKLTNFVFYEEIQKIVLLNRFFATIQTLDLESLEIGYVSCATPSADRQIWLLDNSSFSVKKLNPFTQEIQEIFAIDLLFGSEDVDILQMQEYQNLLFLCASSQGIFVFDNLGNYQKTLPFREVSSLHFDKNQLYFLTKNQVVFYQLYYATKEIYQLDYQGIIKDLVFVNDEIFALHKQQLLRLSKVP